MFTNIKLIPRSKENKLICANARKLFINLNITAGIFQVNNIYYQINKDSNVITTIKSRSEEPRSEDLTTYELKINPKKEYKIYYLRSYDDTTREDFGLKNVEKTIGIFSENIINILGKIYLDPENLWGKTIEVNGEYRNMFGFSDNQKNKILFN